MLPPRAMGTITHIADKGSYNVDVSFANFDQPVMRRLTHSSGYRFWRRNLMVRRLRTPCVNFGQFVLHDQRPTN